MTKEVGVIGLGIMGSRVAQTLVSAGWSVTVYDSNPRALADAASLGGHPAASISEVSASVPLLLLSLPDGPTVEHVALNPTGIFSSGSPGLTVADLSTVGPATPRMLAPAAAERGITWLDTPVSGGPAGAAAGTLTVMVGGDERALNFHREAFETFGAQVEYMGPSGMGATMKVINQLALGIQMVAVSEALTVGVAAGIPARRLWEVLHTATSRCWVLEELVPSVVLENDFDNPRFAVRHVAKDLRLATGTARDLGVPAAAAAIAEQMFSVADGLGWGDKDQMAVLQLYGRAVGIDRW